jgi:plastocyanin
VSVIMQDACDPDSFNAVIGAGACVRNGGMKFDAFIEQLTKLGFVGPWHFAPKSVTARTGQEFLVMNQGGETHTFTEVEEFGGGIVADLNERMHLSTVAPECKALEQDDFVAPGQTYREEIEESGHEKYQCCIHPWMRLEANITEAQGR